MKFFSSDEELSPLADLIMAEDISALESLYEAGWDINELFIICIGVWQLPVSLALCENKLAVLNWLISKGVNLNVEQHPAIVIAASNCNSETIELLLKSSANINAKDYTTNTAVGAALYEKRYDVLELLIANGYKILEDGSALRQAVANKNYPAIKMFLNYGIDVNLHNPDMVYSYNTTAVAEAVRNDDYEIVKLLVEHGADVTIKDDCGERPFNIAVKNKNNELAAFIKTLEPEQWHNEEQRIGQLKGYKIPPELLEILRRENRRIDISSKRTYCKASELITYIEFNSLFNVKEVKWKSYKFLDLLNEVDNYGAEGFLVWFPKKKCLAYADYEHGEFTELCSVKEFFENPSKQIDKVFL